MSEPSESVDSPVQIPVDATPDVPAGSFVVKGQNGQDYLVRPSAGLAAIRSAKATIRRSQRKRAYGGRTRFRKYSTYRTRRRWGYSRRRYRY